MSWEISALLIALIGIGYSVMLDRRIANLNKQFNDLTDKIESISVGGDDSGC